MRDGRTSVQLRLIKCGIMATPDDLTAYADFVVSGLRAAGMNEIQCHPDWVFGSCLAERACMDSIKNWLVRERGLSINANWPESLISQADALMVRNLSEEGLGHCSRRASRAASLYRKAARLSCEPKRSDLFLTVARLEEAYGDGKAAIRAVVEAMQGNPTVGQEIEFRIIWEAWSWTLRGKQPRPFPTRGFNDRHQPLPGQLTLFDLEASVA